MVEIGFNMRRLASIMNEADLRSASISSLVTGNIPILGWQSSLYLVQSTSTVEPICLHSANLRLGAIKAS